jgi:Hint domain
MAGLTITSSSTTGFYLGDTASNPVSIVAGVTINGAASYAIGSAIPIDWTIINSGSLLAPGTSALSYGIVLQPGSASATTSIGSITNTQTGLIEGYFDAVAVRGAGTVANFGTIIARADKGGAVGFDSATSSYSALSAGVVLESGGISNAATALVHGYYIGAAIDSGGSVVNAGTIEGVGTSEGYGVVLSGGGSVTNVTGGTIYGGQDGIEAFTVPISVYNQGLIAGGNRAAIALGVGGAVTNASGATLSGYAAGVEFFSPGASSVTNEARGVIAGGKYGVEVESTSPLTLDNAGILTGTASSGAFLHGGGLVTNALGGTIQGGRYGLFSEDSTTLTNAGAVSGTASAGIAVAAAASISNAASGQIIGGNDGVYIGGTGYSTLTNDGLIVGSIASGAVLSSGGSVINDPTAMITGGTYGIRFTSGAGTVFNAGSVAGDPGARSFGVLMQQGGYLSNAQTGTISGQYYGVVVQSSQGTVVNAGTILSLQAYNHQTPFDAAAVQLAEGGSVTNSAGGFIRAQWIGVQIGTEGSVPVAGTVVNQGTIIATDGTNGAGVWISGPGTIDNAASGTIADGPYAIVAYNQVTVVNAGSIGGSLFGLDAIGTGFADRVVADPGARFSGTFSGGNTLGSAIYSTLELANGSSSGTIANVGTFIDFAQIALDAGASWALGGSIVAGETVAFGGSYAALTLLDPIAAQGTMSGFVASDTIVLAGVTATTGVSFSGNALIVSQSHGPNLSLLFDAPQDLTYAVVDGSTDITTACFAQGTRIQTAAGSRPVEALRPGMQVRSAFGGCREIIWIGHRHVDCARHPRPKTVWPIEIEPGAFGRGLPTATLRVSPDHAIYLNQVLIPARYLVNGTTIRQVSVDEVTYYHVELPRHDVLFAEGLPVESYLDIGDRSNFSGSIPVGLFPDFSTPAPNLAAVWEAAGCAPLVVHGPELEAARTLLSSSGLSAAWPIDSKTVESSR